MNKHQPGTTTLSLFKNTPQAQGQQQAQRKVNARAGSNTSTEITAIQETGAAVGETPGETAGETITNLLRHPGLWQGSHCPRPATHSLATGYAALDQALHQGGWPLAGCTELLASTGSGELQLLAPALQQLAAQGRIALLNPPYPVCAAGFDYLGIPSRQLLIVHSRNGKDGHWACEQLLTSGYFPAVLGWLEPQNPGTAPYQQARKQRQEHQQTAYHFTYQLTYQKLRKLQLCAQNQQRCLLLFRPATLAAQASPASLRIALQARSTQLQLEILKQAGGWGGQQLLLPRPGDLVAMTPAAHQLPVPASNGSRSLPTRPRLAVELNHNNAELKQGLPQEKLQQERLHKATPAGVTRLQ